MAQTLDSLVVELRADIRGLQTSLRAATGEVQRFSGTAEKQVGVFSGALAKAQTAALAFGGAWAAFKVGKDIVDAGMQMQALTNRMIAATGDAKTAAEAMAFVRAESERLGLSFTTTANGFASFAASALRGGLTMQQTKEIFTGVSEAATSLHLSTERVGLVFTALEQMASKGTVQMEELKGQLGESLPGAFEIAAKAMGVTTQEMGKMMSQGEVISSDFLPRFAQALRENMTGSLDEASRSAQAGFARLGNAYFDLKAKMADAGVLDAVTEALRQLTVQLRDPATVSGLVQFAKLLGDIASAALRVTAAIGGAYSAINRGVERVGNGLFGSVFGQSGLDALSKARQERAAGGQQAPARGNAKQIGPVSMIPEMLPGSDMTAALDTGTMSDASLGGGAVPQGGFQTPGGLDDSKLKAMETMFALEQVYRDASVAAEQDKVDQLKAVNDNYFADAQSGLEGFLGIQLRSQQQINADSVADQGETFRTTLQQAANHNKAFFALEKAAAIARALISARESVVSAYAFGTRLGGPVLGAAFAATAAAAQAANIAAIASASYGGGNVGSGGGSGSNTTTSGENQPTDNLGRPIQPATQVYITIEGGDKASFTGQQIRSVIDQINDAQKNGSRVEVYAA